MNLHLQSDRSEYPRLLLQRDRPLSAIRVRKADPSALTAAAGSFPPAFLWVVRASLQTRNRRSKRLPAASPRARRIHFAFNSLSKMLLSASTAARHSGRSHAGFLGASQQWSLRTAFNILRVMAVGRQSALSKMGLSAAPVHAVLSFCLAFRQTGKRRKKSGVVFISQKLTLFFNQCAVAATIGGVKPIDFRLSDLLCGPLSRLPRRVVFAAFPGGFEVVACAVGRPRKCKSQCNDCNVAHQSIPPGAATTHIRKNHLQGSGASAG